MGDRFTWTGAVSPHYLVPGNWIDDTTGDDPALRAPNVSDTVDISSAGLIDGDGGSAATLDLSGTNTLDGVLSVTVASIFGTLMLNGTLSATSGMSLSATGILDASGSLVGPLDDEGTITAAGTLTIGGPVSGTGFLDVAAGADLTLGSTIASGLNIGFAGSGGTLTLAAPGSVLAPVLGFGQGDAIVLDGIGSATSVRFAGETLALLDASGSLVASLALGLPLVNVPYASSNFQIATTGGNATITFQTPSVVDANAANAMQAGTARSTYGVSGAGITIGIISDGFDSAGEAQDIAAGNLPAASQINILNAGTGVEGRSMAEMIYQIAPGATIDFAAAGADENSFAQAVQQLRAAGATIIVDDILFPDQPFFQLGGTAQNAVQGAIAAGIDYFTSAGNSGDEYYENQFAPITSSLPGMGVQTAMDFGGGNALQQLVVPRGSSITLELQWAQPFASVGGGAGASGSLALVLYDALGNIVTTASVDDIGSDPMQQLNYTNTSASNVLQLAIVQTAGTVAPGTLLKYVVVSGSVIIEDPNAGTGSGSLYGQQLVPDANVVGATAYSETPAFGVATPVPEPFSSVGPGETFTYGAQGNITSTQSAGQISFTAAVGSWTAALGHAFVGTSAAAPEAAAVAALMLQANPLLTTMDVTNLLKDFGTDDERGYRRRPVRGRTGPGGPRRRLRAERHDHGQRKRQHQTLRDASRQCVRRRTHAGDLRSRWRHERDQGIRRGGTRRRHDRKSRDRRPDHARRFREHRDDRRHGLGGVRRRNAGRTVQYPGPAAVRAAGGAAGRRRKLPRDDRLFRGGHAHPHPGRRDCHRTDPARRPCAFVRERQQCSGSGALDREDAA